MAYLSLVTVQSSICAGPFILNFLYVAGILTTGNADFIVETGADLPDEDVGRRMHRRPLPMREDEQED
ncbi:hypothetical protein Gorai_016285, partial [Gossypium raimondii]|nr:hypothetical protein [Gossypium raimondii]